MFRDYIDIIKNNSLFSGIDEEDIITLLNCLKPSIYKYNKNDYIIMAGDEFVSIGIVVNGEVTIIKENAIGDRVVISIMKSGNIFGEMAAFSSSSKWPASVQAKERCEVLFLEKGKIIGECQKTCSWHRKLVQNMLRILSERALMLNKKIEYLSIKSIRGKISMFILEQHKKTNKLIFTIEMNRNDLADYLNVSRPSMSREMCKMRDEGVIEFHLSTIKIKDLDALKTMVN